MREGEQHLISPLEASRNNIREWVKDELRKKKEWEQRNMKGDAYDPHANEIDPDLIAPRELTAWNKWKDGTGDIAEFQRERAEAFAAGSDAGDERARATKENLWGYLGNRMSNAIFKELLEEEQAHGDTQ